MTIDTAEFVNRAIALPDTLADCHPRLSRRTLRCHECGRVEHNVDFAECFRSGWPLCCEQTMTIDSPVERAESETDNDD